MRRTALLLLPLLLLPGLAAAQGFTLAVPATSFDTTEVGDHEFFATLTNTQLVEDSFTLTLEDEDSGTNMPEDWITSLCTHEGCLWSGFRSTDLVLAEGAADSLVGVYFQFSSEGSGTMVFTVASANTGAVDSVSFTITAGSNGVEPRQAMPASIELSPVYPNPFNGQTTVRFNLPRQMAVKLVAHTVDGRVLATLAEGRLPAGEHRRQLSLDRNMASGNYLIRLTAGGQTRLTNAILLK